MENNFNVFPIAAGAKSPPLIKDFPNKSKPRSEWPDVFGACNWGVHCEGMIVVDVDVRGGGIESLNMLEMVYGLPERTYSVTTPTGGSHLYYRLPAGHPGVMNSASKLAPGIDIKSTGGYVVAAGSKVPAGEYIASDYPIVEAPAWLVEKLGVFTEREQKPKVEIPDAPLNSIERAREWLQGRPVGDEAFATACGLRDFGLSQGQAMALLVAHDGRSVSVLESKVQHAYEYAKGEAGSKAITADEFEDVPVQAPPKPKHGLIPFAELATGARPTKGYLVKGLLQRGSHAVAYGPPGAGKTFVALDLAYHVAAGREWMGHRVRQGAVLYLAYEGMGGLAKRARALRLHYGKDSLPLYFQPADFNLREKAGRQALAQVIAELPEKPALIVIDTLARAMKGGDENSAQDMGSLNDAVGALIESTGACVVLIHHSGKNKQQGARGSSALLGALDTEIEIDDNRITPTKQRDVELAEPIGFRLEPIMVGMDEDGDEIVSCVVQQADIMAKVKLTKTARDMLQRMAELKPNNGPLDEADVKSCERGKRGWRKALAELIEADLVEDLENGTYVRKLE